MRRVLIVITATLAVLSCLFLVGCKQEVSDPKSDVDTMNEIVSGTEPFYVLLVGNDTREGTVDDKGGPYYVYSDTMMLAYVEPGKYKVSLISIPRDTESTVDGAPAKVNSAYTTHGIEGAIEQVEMLTGVTISYYANCSFVTFTKLFDALGGAHGTVPIEMTLKDIVNGGKITLMPGEQDMKGAQALVLARVRKEYLDFGEACRQMASREMVANAIKAVAGNPDNVEKCVDAFLSITDTDFDREKLLSLATVYAAHADQVTVVTCTGPYEAEAMEEYDGEVMVPRDEKTWKKVIEAVVESKDPNAIIAPPVPQPMPEEE